MSLQEEHSASQRQIETLIEGLPDGIITFSLDGTLRYVNEAALTMHEVQSRAELGDSAEAYQRAFTWRDPQGKPLPVQRHPAERLMNGEPFTGITVQLRRASPEDSRFFRCRSLLLSDDEGQPDYWVLVLKEVTAQHEAEARFEQTFAANPAPAIICRLSDLRYIKVNPGFLRMTGYKREELIGRTAYEIDILAGAKDRKLALEHLQNAQVVPQMEALLETKDSGTKFVVVAGQPLEIDDGLCMLFSFIDLDARKKAEDALRQSEERFSKAFQLAPVAASLSLLDDLRILDVNEAFGRVMGYGSGEVIGHTAAELNLWVEEAERREVAAALREGRGYRDAELKLRTKSGEVRNVLASAEVLTINGEACTLSMFQDITERKRSEAELVEAIQVVMKDTSWFSHTVVEKLAQLKSGAPSSTAELAELTKRERQVLELLCGGWTNEQIAEELGVAKNTARNYVASIYEKVGVSSRVDAANWARARGVVAPR